MNDAVVLGDQIHADAMNGRMKISSLDTMDRAKTGKRIISFISGFFSFSNIVLFKNSVA